MPEGVTGKQKGPIFGALEPPTLRGLICGYKCRVFSFSQAFNLILNSKRERNHFLSWFLPTSALPNLQYGVVGGRELEDPTEWVVCTSSKQHARLPSTTMFLTWGA